MRSACHKPDKSGLPFNRRAGAELDARERALATHERELEKARTINPKDGRLYHTFGMVLYELKNYSVAATVFEAAERLNPANAELRLMRGAALIETGRLNEAEDEIARADQISSHKLPIVHLHLARVYEKRGNRRRAADELESYLRQKPEADNAAAIREAIKRLRTT